jgi:hypothetical protein
MAAVVPIKKPDFLCGTCRYFGWKALEKWCRHPTHPAPYIPRRACAIMGAGGLCREYLEVDAKAMPGQPSPWPDPVNLEEV